MRCLLLVWALCAPSLASGAPADWSAHAAGAEAAFRKGDYAAAEDKYLQAIADVDIAPHQEPRLGNSLLDLARVRIARARYTDAEPLILRAVQVYSRLYGADHPYTAVARASLAALWAKEGRYADAEKEFGAAQALLDKDHGSERSLATVLNNHADVLFRQGDYAGAEDLHRRSLTMRERIYGRDSLPVAISLSNLGLVYQAEAREGDTEQLYRRALEIREKVLGPEAPQVANSLGNRSVLYSQQGRLDDALALRRRATMLQEKAGAGNELDLALSLNNLGVLEDRLGHFKEAESDHRRALSIRERLLNASHPDIGVSLNNLAASLKGQGRFSEAEGLYQRSLHLREAALGPEHPDVVSVLGNLAVLYHAEHRDAEALDLIRRVNRLAQTRTGIPGAATGLVRSSESETFAQGYLFQVELLAEQGAADHPAVVDEAFKATQMSRAGGTAGALARMAARFAAGNDELARLVRERQDQIARARWLDSELIDAAAASAGARVADQENAMRAEVAELTRRIAASQVTLESRFPEYQALASPEPMGIKEFQALLKPDEAMLAYLVDEKQTWVWVLRRDKVGFLKLPIGRSALNDAVAGIRRQIDLSKGVLLPFSGADAFTLYRKIFAPAEPYLAGARDIMVVPDGALQSLPLALLVSQSPSDADARQYKYRSYAWLTNKYAFTTLPAESSLRALRRFAGKAPGDQAFTGFGDPTLKGSPGEGSRGMTPARIYGRGGLADLQALNMLEQLPETADELRSIASTLGAPRNIYLGPEATESAVKRADLSKVRTLAFATHGLVAGISRL